MILVDSSVWIDYFRSAETPQVALLDSLFGCVPLVVGDLIAVEVLQGIRSEREFRHVTRIFASFRHIDIVDYELAVKAAQHYRVLRTIGITVRKTIDVLIAARCIEDGLTLLHADRDFLPFTKHFGLQVAYSEP
ncbi:PIN domain-containing protein [Duganella sp. FT80W]|uniref:Ribonuclease VapC n=1 Tax=Duganella guangzhouensis TaxID=2666084 RepID=A0A6I2KYE9_9BURK|nr:PIN domain nuclease [Duganella guangzhouensis]MRW89039.1 PIN domain-containing protein [Duganella guangzhouensis]